MTTIVSFTTQSFEEGSKVRRCIAAHRRFVVGKRCIFLATHMGFMRKGETRSSIIKAHLIEK